MKYEQEEDIVRAVADIIWRNEISIAEFYSALGVDLDNVSHSDTDVPVAKLAGILEGWSNPRSEG